MKTDIIVIGGGHAGIEAAYAAASRNLSVLLVTNHLDLIGHMSCNPAIGGIAKGNIVREIDALGGLMGRIIDKSGIHFKMLNQSKGSAVWGNRAQADKVAYRILARRALEERKNINFLQGMVHRILVKGECVCGIEMDSGEKIEGTSVVLAAGTFLDGVVHIGLTSFSAGRAGEPPSRFITDSINQLGIKSGRLKTGTSPRLDARTINFEKFMCQPGDPEPWPFSFSTKEKLHNKAFCWIGRTQSRTHQIIRDNLDKSPLYTGKISSIGPRYCPSIEDKVVRFGERDSHTLFLEPESLENNEIYLNGLSTSLPFEVQKQLVQSVDGLEKAQIIRPGYGIEYSYFQPNQLRSTLESKKIKNLFFAGQINGTSGYEEAGCQGLVAGVNAAQTVLGEQEFVLGRETSYTGVLIDDLITKGTEEPYRMFTSRAEHRLLLRQDNCDERLMPIAKKYGLIEKELFEERQIVWEKKNRTISLLKKTTIYPDTWKRSGTEELKQAAKASELLKRPRVTLNDIAESTQIEIPNEREIKCTIEADIKYSGFIDKEYQELEKQKKLDQEKIPDDFNYDLIQGFLTESRVKMKNIRPSTIGQASRIGGITPADISILTLHIAKHKKPHTVFHVEQQPPEQETV